MNNRCLDGWVTKAQTRMRHPSTITLSIWYTRVLLSHSGTTCEMSSIKLSSFTSFIYNTERTEQFVFRRTARLPWYKLDLSKLQVCCHNVIVVSFQCLIEKFECCVFYRQQAKKLRTINSIFNWYFKEILIVITISILPLLNNRKRTEFNRLL